VPGSDYALDEKETGGKTKDGVGLLLGVTQVMTRNWLSEFNVSIDRFHGYLNDPYKFTSIINSAGGTVGYVYENRPDERTRKSAYWENRVAWNSRISTALSLRYMSDDWGVCSDTAQLHPRWSLSNGDRYIEPTVRWYRQTAGHGLANEFLAARELIIRQKDDRIGGIERHPRVDASSAGRSGPIRVGLARRRLGCQRIDRGAGREAQPVNEQGSDGEKCKGCQQPIFHSLLRDADALEGVALFSVPNRIHSRTRRRCRTCRHIRAPPKYRLAERKPPTVLLRTLLGKALEHFMSTYPSPHAALRLVTLLWLTLITVDLAQGESPENIYDPSLPRDSESWGRLMHCHMREHMDFGFMNLVSAQS
jgi:Protein of unknown function (DUF3570)